MCAVRGAWRPHARRGATRAFEYDASKVSKGSIFSASARAAPLKCSPAPADSLPESLAVNTSRLTKPARLLLTILLACLAVSIAGCTPQLIMPDGRSAYHKICGGARSRCYEYMGDVCPRGYTVLEENCIGPRAVGGAAIDVNVNVGEGHATQARPVVACHQNNVIFRCK